MKIINRELGGGKTTALVEFMLAHGNDDVIFVAPTKMQAIQIGYRTATTLFGKAESPELKARFISAAELGNHPNARFVVDEIEGVLHTLMPGRVLAIAGTDEDLKAGQLARIRGER